MLDAATSTRGRVISLVVVFVAGGLVAAATGGEPIGSEPDPGARTEAGLDDHPATPNLVPREVPDGYELWPSPAWSTPQGDPGAIWVYRPSDEADAPAISLCIVPNTLVDREISCVPAGHEAIARHEHGGYTAFIVPLGPGADRVDDATWDELDLTESWEDVDWTRG